MTIPRDEIIDWLLAGDPAIRWQVMGDLLDAPALEVAAERARVEDEGWGAALLAAQDADGLWAGGACFPGGWDWRTDEPGQPWTATLHTLQTLRLLGLPGDSSAARRTARLVAANGRWEHAGQRYFEGEVEPCINGRTVEAGAWLGVDVTGIVDRLLADQLGDGGWNCEAENGSVVSSMATTLDVIEGLAAWERERGPDDAVREARRRGEEYLLERHLFRRKSTGAVIDPDYVVFAFPFYWQYDVLRALDHFRSTDAGRDPRMAEAVEIVRSRRRDDGRWRLDRVPPGRVHFHLEPAAEPSRWITLRALRVLGWWDGLRA
jgi:hypothetical protein